MAALMVSLWNSLKEGLGLAVTNLNDMRSNRREESPRDVCSGASRCVWRMDSEA
jgi:hypothetical protein